MTHRKAIVLPARLVGVVRAGGVVTPSPCAEPPAEPVQPPQPPPVDPAEAERTQLGQLLTRLAARIDQLHATAPPIAEVQQAAIELGMAIAARLVFHHIEAGTFGIEQLVRGALDGLPTRHAATVFLHPDDLALLQERLGGDLAALHAEQPVQWRADTSLARGDCKVQAGELAVWSSVRQRLQQARTTLLEGIAEGGHAS